MKRLKTIILFSIGILLIFYDTTGSFARMNSTDNTSSHLSDTLDSEVSNVEYSYYSYFFGLNSYGNTIKEIKLWSLVS
jgi:hypothetical protein